MDEQEVELGYHDGEQVWLSMLEHYVYCPRQFALIHIEQVFDENIFTLKGSQEHERINEAASGEINGVRFERSLPLFHQKLAMTGIADLVEFPDGIPYPVEYKHSWHRGRKAAEVQLCAQALCLEEMFNCEVKSGAIYSIKSHKRYEIALNTELENITLNALREVRLMLASGKTPPAVNDARCRNCSLVEACIPETTSSKNSDKVDKLSREIFQCR